MATPIIFAALAALICNKAGMFNMGIEGMMLFSALGAVGFAHLGGSWWAGLLGGLVIGLLSGIFIAFASITGKADLYLTCIAFNLAATGGTVFVMYLLTGEKSTTSGAFRSYQIPNINIPLIRDIPVIGRIISGQSLLTYVAVLSVWFVAFLLKRTRVGLRIRSVGENPKAAESVGISVKKIGYIAFLYCGLFAGLSGTFLSMSWVTFFMKNMVNGRGYIGLSAQNMANGNPVGSALVSLLFGATSALSLTLKSQSNFPTEFLEMIPYLATIIAIIFTSLYSIHRRKKIEQGIK
jgi:simple sugar transport system permease protein